MIELLVALAIVVLALNVHELGHLLEARRRGARVGYVGWALLPGVTVLIGPAIDTRFRLGLPHTLWEPGARTTKRDQLRIYRAGPVLCLCVAVVLSLFLYVHYAFWILIAAVVFMAAGAFPLIGFGSDSDGAQIRALKRGGSGEEGG